jgi:hypothetical protein
MTQQADTLIENLAAQLHEASMTPEYAEAMKLWNSQHAAYKAEGKVPEASPGDVWTVLARWLVEHRTETTRNVFVKKLVPGLRGVNRELSKRIGMGISLKVQTSGDPEPQLVHEVELVPMDPNTNWTCSNCGAAYPIDADACPKCGVK